MNITVGTFNLNNLFSRYNFEAEVELIEEGAIGLEAKVSFTFAEPIAYQLRTYNGRLVKAKSVGERAVIAERIRRMDVDVLAVQEVEDIGVLREFALIDLAGAYPYQVLIEGNDPRLIDLGLLSKFPVGAVSSWQHATHDEAPMQRVFGRDLLEVEIYDPLRRRRLFTLYNNHLKSNFVRWNVDQEEGKKRNERRRRRQAEMVARIIEARMPSNGRYIILGDMNDSPESTALAPMVTAPGLGLINALATPQETRPAKAERAPSVTPTDPAWTHRFKKSRQPAVHELFDQIWISPAFANNLDRAWIDRRTKHSGNGSDHDPAWIELRDI